MIENPIFSKPIYTFFWLLLLLKASHKEQKIMFNGEFILIKEGQILTGRDQLVKESRLPSTTIERILKYLENGHQIGQQKTTKYRIITILNWSEHQKRTSNRTSNGHQTDIKRTHTRMYKNEKNDKEVLLAAEPQVDINRFIKLFEPINPSYEQLFKNKTQRGAMERLIKKWGEEKMEATIKALPAIIIKPYAPKITTPNDLERDFGKLIAFYKQQKVADNTKKSRIIQ